MHKSKMFLTLLFLGVSACARLTPDVSQPPQLPKYKVALILGGGAARGFAHVGVIRVLEREKIPIDIIIGTSVGSLVGAIYADKKNSFELEWLSFSLDEKDIFDYTLTSPTQGFVRGDRLENFVLKTVEARDIRQLKLPYAAVATDIEAGETVVLRSGPVARAVRASSAIPGIFFPVRHVGKLLVDGGVLNNVPADVGRQLGAEVVIAVNLATSRRAPQVQTIFDTLVQTFNLMALENTRARLKAADVVIQPEVADIGLMDFSRKKDALISGMQAAEQALPQIREKLLALSNS